MTFRDPIMCLVSMAFRAWKDAFCISLYIEDVTPCRKAESLPCRAYDLQ